MDFYFLLFSLFFPRITMVWYFLWDAYPANTVPLWADWLLGIFVPRILVLIYIYQNLGYQDPWFWIHLVAALLAWFGGSWRTYRWRQVRYVDGTKSVETTEDLI
jgi:hypothetical protein